MPSITPIPRWALALGAQDCRLKPCQGQPTLPGNKMFGCFFLARFVSAAVRREHHGATKKET